MNVDPIPAVVFTKDEIANSTELNGIFTIPHSLKLETDLAKYSLIDTTAMGKDRRSISRFEGSVFYINQSNNIWNAVATYYSLNALDLYRNSIYKLISTYLPDPRVATELYTQPEGIFGIVKIFICPDGGVYTKQVAGMTAWDGFMYAYISSDPNTDSFKKAFLRFEQAADSIIQIFTINYVNFINNLVDYLAPKGLLDAIYAYIYKIVYGKDLHLDGPLEFSTIINFITAILREAAEQELQLIRNGLSMLSSNATFMLAKQIQTIDMGQFAEDNFPIKDAADYVAAITDVSLEEDIDNGNTQE